MRNDTLCVAFWKYATVLPTNEVMPCCRFTGKGVEYNGEDLDDVLNSDVYELWREYNKEGKQIPGCEACYFEDKVGARSLRKVMNEMFMHDDIIEVKGAELVLDNICNLRCDGCHEKWSTEWGKFNSPEKETKDHVISNKLFTGEAIPDTIEKIFISGGEPLMTKRHFKVLEKVKKKEKTEVVYQTNGTFLLNDETIKLLKKFLSVSFIVSIDAYGELNDKVRRNSKWSDIVAFIDQVKMLGYGITVNSMLHYNSWETLKELSEWIRKQNVEWKIKTLIFPPELNIKNIEDKDGFIGYINSIDYLPERQAIIAHMKE